VADVLPTAQETGSGDPEAELIDNVLGTHVPLEEAEAILKRLNFTSSDWAMGVGRLPRCSGRRDDSEDLVEEVGRSMATTVFSNAAGPPPR